MNKDTKLTLYQACINKDNELALSLLKNPEKCNINYINEYGVTALMWACDKKMTEVALKMIDVFGTQGCRPEQVDENGYTALLLACYNNMSEVALKMIDVFGAQGCRPEHVNKNGDNAFIWACDKKMSEVALKMIDVFSVEGCKPEQVCNNGNTALIFACCNNMSDVALKMIDVFGAQGCKSEQVNENGYTALLLACYNNMSEVALKMIDVFGAQGCNPAQINSNSNTAFIWACDNNMSDVALKMIDVFGAQGCRPEQVNINGNTALLLAYNNNMSEVVDILLSDIKNNANSPTYRENIITSITHNHAYKLLYKLMNTYPTIFLETNESRLTLSNKLFAKEPRAIVDVNHYYLEKCIMLCYNHDILNISDNALSYIRIIIKENRRIKSEIACKLALAHINPRYSVAITGIQKVFTIDGLRQTILDFIYTDYEPSSGPSL